VPGPVNMANLLINRVIYESLADFGLSARGTLTI
jgi:hypothetical protein